MARLGALLKVLAELCNQIWLVILFRRTSWADGPKSPQSFLPGCRVRRQFLMQSKHFLLSCTYATASSCIRQRGILLVGLSAAVWRLCRKT